MLTRSCLKLNYVCICPTCSERRLRIEVLRKDTKGSDLFTPLELSKVKGMKEGIKNLESLSHSDRLAFWNSSTVLGSGSYIGDEIKPIPHPKVGLESKQIAGVRYRVGSVNMPKVLQAFVAEVRSQDPTKLFCSFCEKEVDRINASFGTGAPKSVKVLEIVDHDKDGNPIIQEVIKRNADKLVACPECSLGIKPHIETTKDKNGKIVERKVRHSNVHTYSEG